MLIDTHCHLDASEFDGDRDDVLADARRSGVRAIVIPAIGASNFDAVAALCDRNDDCVYALGIHPMVVDRAAEGDLEALRARIRRDRDDPRLVAVGEIGLDHFVPGLDHARQQRFFAAQLAIAREFDLPVLLHVRRSVDSVLKQLRLQRPRGGIAHAFNGSAQQAGMFVEMDFALGFGGAMTYTRALRIRGLARDLPAEALVLETDAPDIAPAWASTRRNTPGELGAIARELATLRGVEVTEVVEQTSRNALRVLPRLASRLASLGRLDGTVPTRPRDSL